MEVNTQVNLKYVEKPQDLKHSHICIVKETRNDEPSGI
jgi:hypothetical protein